MCGGAMVKNKKAARLKGKEINNLNLARFIYYNSAGLENPQ